MKKVLVAPDRIHLVGRAAVLAARPISKPVPRPALDDRVEEPTRLGRRLAKPLPGKFQGATYVIVVQRRDGFGGVRFAGRGSKCGTEM